VSAEQVAMTPVCAECEAVWLSADPDRWQAHFDFDDVLHFSARSALSENSSTTTDPGPPAAGEASVGWASVRECPLSKSVQLRVLKSSIR
jgi:hypothetical protein